MTDNKEINPLHITWHDSAWIPNLNQSNVLDYFSDRTNSFYDRTCNNEIIKMQRLNPVQLNNMVGIEYILLHVQEPILYVIRKQHRHSPTQVTPIADYYVLAGVVYQAPDLNSLVNSRVHSTLYHLQSAFDETYSYARYHPSKGYWWEFKDTDKDNKEKLDKNKERIKEETPATTFQRQRVDILLNELAKKFPYKTQQQPVQQANDRTQSASNSTAGDSEVKSEIKTEKNDSQNNSFANPNSNRLSGGPLEKKQKLI